MMLSPFGRVLRTNTGDLVLNKTGFCVGGKVKH